MDWAEFGRGILGGLIAGCLCLFTGLVLAAIVFVVLFVLVAFLG